MVLVEESFDDKFEIEHYEVLGDEVQKYTSTSVSGGGYGKHATPVRSTTHYHSDQHIWLKNLRTGKEEDFEFTSFNVSARPGHKLMCIFDRKHGLFERVVNLDTGKVSSGSGVFNKSSSSPGVISSVLLSILFSAFCFIHMMPLVYLAITIYVTNRYKKSYYNLPESIKKKFNKGLMVMVATLFAFIWWLYLIATERSYDYEPFWLTAPFLVFPNALLFWWLLRLADSYKEHFRAIINGVVDRAIENYKPDVVETEQKSA